MSVCDIIDIPIPISLPRKAILFPTLMRENYIQTLDCPKSGRLVQKVRKAVKTTSLWPGNMTAVVVTIFSANNWNCVFQYFGAIRVELIDIPAFDPISLK